MKILIAHDGSSFSDAALDDLRSAGLPADAEAIVVSVAEVWLPPPPAGKSVSEYAIELQTKEQPFKAYREHGKAVTEADGMAKNAAARLRRDFPPWKISAEATYGSPAWEIISRAETMNADLIVVGAQGKTAVERIVLGSISQKVLTEAHCSVRVGRGKIQVDPTPVRVVIGYDASAGANASVDAVANRHWPAGTEVKLVSVTDPITPSIVGQFIPGISDWVEDTNKDEQEWLISLADSALARLRAAGLSADIWTGSGSPKDVITDEAERWHADAIFVGANRFGSRVERFLLGSVSSAVVSRAHCSVEVVRR